MMERVKTYVDELDAALEGGIPKGNAVLLSGTPGTGKTTLAMQFLFNGCKNADERGIYVTLIETEERLHETFGEYDFYDRETIESGDINIVDLRKIEYNQGTKFGQYVVDPQFVLNPLAEILTSQNPKRVVLDSVTAICHQFEDKKAIREFLFGLGNLLAHLECTALLVSELQKGGHPLSDYLVEEFICDGIVLMSQTERKNRLAKTLQIVKMRGTHHSDEKYLVRLGKQGVQMLRMLEYE